MRIPRVFPVVLGLLVAMPTVPALSSVPASSPGSASSSVPETVAGMTLREKVGQLVMFSVQGLSLSSTEREVIRSEDLGGVILFSKNYRDRTQLANLTEQIQRAVAGATTHRIGALVAVDQEGGVVKRFPDMAPWYSAPEMGASGNPDVAFDQGRLTGRDLIAAGVNVDFAPVADLDLPPAHVMRSRSFGSKASRVARYVSAFGRGLQRKRVAATVKHFPGLGGATANSDDGRAYVYRSKWKLHHVDAVPFQKAIEKGARMVMMSHAIYVKDGGDKPASLNRYIATKRLRRELGFKGVAISDALEPVSWYFGGRTRRACRATIWAGVDIALITGDVYAARSCAAEIRAAVRSGAISKKRLNSAVRRVLRLKSWLGV